MSGVLARFPWLLPVRNSFASYGASAVTRTRDRGHVAEVKKPIFIGFSGSQSGFPKKPFSPLMSTCEPQLSSPGSGSLTEIDPTRREPGGGQQRPRVAKPSRGHAPQPGHRPAQPPVAAHPDRPRPQGAGLRPPAPFILSAVGAQFTNHVCAAGSQVVFATPPRSPHKHDQTLCT